MAARRTAPPHAWLTALYNRGCYFFEDRSVSVDFAEAAQHFKLLPINMIPMVSTIMAIVFVMALVFL